MANSDFFHLLSGGLFFDKKKFSNDIKHFQKVTTPSSPQNQKQSQKGKGQSQQSKKILSIKGKERDDEDNEDEDEDEVEDRSVEENDLDGDEADENEDNDGDEANEDDNDAEENGNDDNQDSQKQLVVKPKRKMPTKKLRKHFKIKAAGSDVPAPFQTFDELESKKVIRKYMLRNIQTAGYTNPTPIQMQAVPVMLKSRDLIACAPTGSGKTLAFILPILASLKKPAKLGFRALVLSPTRELAQQTHREFERIAEGKGWRIVLLTKATANTNNLGPKSSQRFDILISTPLRLIQLIQKDGISLSNLQTLVLDEADKLFDLGFLEQIDEIINACVTQSSKVQKAMFSATMMPAIEALALTILHDPVRVTIGAKNAATATIKQKLVFVGSEEGKVVAIRQQIQEGLKPPILIFVQSKERANDLFHELVYEGINVDVISADRTKAQRDAIVTNFRSGKLWVLIATDLMARGIDFKGVSCVINYDFPQTVTQYIHRIGRTGRAGREGESITFYTESDVEMIKTIANVMRASGCDVPEWILKLKAPSKQKKREIAKRPISREEINPVSLFDQKRANKKRMYIESTKRSKNNKKPKQ